MKIITQNFHRLFSAKNSIKYMKINDLRRIKNVMKKLDASQIMGENVPYTVLEHFAK